MRIALIDRPSPQDRPDGVNRFTGVTQFLRAQGHEVFLLNGAPADDGRAPPILTGLNRAVAASPLTEAYALAQHLADLSLELVIAPLRGGIAQGVLMARACGEAFTTTRVALWCDTSSRSRFLRADDVSTGLAPLIADALERQTLSLADALIVPDEASIASVNALAPYADITFRASLPIPQTDSGLSVSPPRDIEEIVFMGPLQRHTGVIEFIEVAHRLWTKGLLAGRTITFLGPARPVALGISKEWLGLRAGNWPFTFKIMDEADPEQQRRYVGEVGRLGVAIVDDPDEFLSIRCGGRHVILQRMPDAGRSLSDRLELALHTALDSTRIPPPAKAAPLEWAGLVTNLATLPRPAGALRPPPKAGVTICVLHHNRLTQLAAALASIPDIIGENPVEILVLENGSDIDGVEDEIRKLAGPRPLLRIVGFQRPVRQAFALNRGLIEARFETILFLDDDNYFTPTGVAQLARAVAGGLDIAVTALDVFDDGAAGAPTVGRLIFLGAAFSAGLFFNAFGDTAMAVRRDSFLRLGGFEDPGFDYPSLDWVTLAKAQAAGLRIGALQWPAVRYRRNTARADMVANKLDQEGARSLVFEAYGGAFDAELVARYAQKQHIEDL